MREPRNLTEKKIQAKLAIEMATHLCACVCTNCLACDKKCWPLCSWKKLTKSLHVNTATNVISKVTKGALERCRKRSVTCNAMNK